MTAASSTADGAPYGDELLGQKAGEGLAATTAYLFGRRTYEKLAAHWPHQPDDDPIAAHLSGSAAVSPTTRHDAAGSRQKRSGLAGVEMCVVCRRPWGAIPSWRSEGREPMSFSAPDFK